MSPAVKMPAAISQDPDGQSAGKAADHAALQTARWFRDFHCIQIPKHSNTAARPSAPSIEIEAPCRSAGHLFVTFEDASWQPVGNCGR